MSDDAYSTRREKGSGARARRTDELLSVLSTRRRRVALEWVCGQRVATVEELATVVARATGIDVERATVSLRHVDLPALSEAGLLEYDCRSSTIRYDGDDDVEDVLAALPDE